MNLIDRWKRRYWREDAAAIASLRGHKPAVLITGGSEGIGFALAKAFATPDHATVLVARSQARLDEARDALVAAGCANVLTLSQDLTEPSCLDAISDFLNEHDLYVDILINSAAIGTGGDFADEPAEKLTTLAELNVTALTRLNRAFLPPMLTRGRGGIINIASLGGFAPGPYQAAYYASKAYVISLTRALAHETRGQGVRIAAVAPGPVNSEFHARAHAQSALYRLILPALTPQQVAASTRRGYGMGHSLIVPGVFNNFMGLAMRILPADVLITPLIAILLKPRSPR